MTDQISPLPASCRTSDADFPGVVADLGFGWRLAVTMDAKGYSLQRWVADAGAWLPAGGRSPASPEKIAAKYGDQVEGLVALCASLPPVASAALPVFAERRRLQLEVLAERDPTSASYVRVVARDGQMRLAVDPHGQLYLLQWVRAADLDEVAVPWKLLASVPTLSKVRDFILEKVFEPVGKGAAGRRNGDALLGRVDDLFSGLPERADEGSWLPLPPLP